MNFKNIHITIFIYFFFLCRNLVKVPVKSEFKKEIGKNQQVCIEINVHIANVLFIMKKVGSTCTMY